MTDSLSHIEKQGRVGHVQISKPTEPPKRRIAMTISPQKADEQFDREVMGKIEPEGEIEHILHNLMWRVADLERRVEDLENHD